MLVSIIPAPTRTAQNTVVSILFHMSKSKNKVIAGMHSDLKDKKDRGGLISYMGM